MAQWKMFLQAYVAAESYEQAFPVAENLIRTVRPIAGITDCRISPYYKFEDQYGVCLLLEADDMPEAWRALQPILAADWHVGGDETNRHAIWDHRLNGPCPIRAARWFNLELYATGELDDLEKDEPEHLG